MKFALAFALLFSITAVHAEEADCDETTPKEVKTVMKAVKMVSKTSCIDKPNIFRQKMCLYIGLLEKDPNPTKNIKYKFQRLVLEGACVDQEKDSQEVVNKKVAAMWKEHEKILYCNALTFEVMNGNAIKFAVQYTFDDYIEQVAEWKIDLNHVDQSDGRTLLDYVQKKIDESEALRGRMQRYYDILRKAGAKHKSEL
ncbi:MAG: hypothetical protein NDI69_00165 [Bacteriovoracaceae bacterium]|nr:hypothetical protein [Bacteriovoracaceae bacterium]